MSDQDRFADLKARKKTKEEQLKTLLKENAEDVVGRTATTPENYKPGYQRALLGFASLRGAIRLKCAECCGFEDVINRVRDCSVMRCPLRAYRPYRTKKDDNEDV